MVVEGYLSAIFRHFLGYFRALDPYVSYYFLPECVRLNVRLTLAFRFEIRNFVRLSVRLNVRLNSKMTIFAASRKWWIATASADSFSRTWTVCEKPLQRLQFASTAVSIVIFTAFLYYLPARCYILLEHLLNNRSKCNANVNLMSHFVLTLPRHQILSNSLHLKSFTLSSPHPHFSHFVSSPIASNMKAAMNISCA